MLKRIAAFLVLLTMVFAFQGNVWAASVNAEDAMAKQQTEVIALAENPQLAALNEDIQLLGATGFGGMKIEPWFWVLNLLIPGLGQFLMGDVMRGVLFFLGGAILAAIWGASAFILASLGLGSVAFAIGIAMPLLFLALRVWDIVDAYFMNQAKVGMSSIDQMQMMADVRDEVMMVAEIMQKNQIVAVDGGLGLNSQLATF